MGGQYPLVRIYLFGVAKKRETISDIHEYAEDHFSAWFPDLPSYQSYNRRLNWLKAVLSPLVENTLQELDCEEPGEARLNIADSMPIMIAKGQRASQGSVASEWAPDVGYCSSKDTYYHGVKLDVIVGKRGDKLPLPDRGGMTPGSENDPRALRRVLPAIEGGVLCGDKVDCDGSLKERLGEDQNLDLPAPNKKEKGQKTLQAADKLYSEAVNRIRQPIESLFCWIDEETGFRRTPKVRSYRGVVVHMFGRLAAAMLILTKFDTAGAEK